MKYVIETNADNGDSFYSKPFDTIGEVIEEMAYKWRLLSPQSKSEIRKRNYLATDRLNPYMEVLGGITETTIGTFTLIEAKEVVTLAEMIEAKENEEEMMNDLMIEEAAE